MASAHARFLGRGSTTGNGQDGAQAHARRKNAGGAGEEGVAIGGGKLAVTPPIAKSP